MFKWLNWIRALNHSEWALLPEETIVCKVYWANDNVKPLSVGLMYVPNISKQHKKILLNPNEFYFMSGLMLRYLPACRSKTKRVGNDKLLSLFGRKLILASEIGKCILTVLLWCSLDKKKKQEPVLLQWLNGAPQRGSWGEQIPFGSDSSLGKLWAINSQKSHKTLRHTRIWTPL